MLGARADEAEAVASYEAAEGRGWKYSSLVKGWAIWSEPTGFPSGPATMLPFAWKGKKACPITQRTAG